MVPRHRLLPACAAAAALLLGAAPVHAKILKSRLRRALLPAGELRLVLGSGFEFEADSESVEYGFPFLIEYGFSDVLKLSVEPSGIVIHEKGGSTIGRMGDLETTLLCGFPTERRYRPGVALEGAVKWPTAPRGEVGTGKRDVSLGAIVSKEFNSFDMDVNIVYTFTGSPPGTRLVNTLEASVATEWHLTPDLDIEAELVTSIGAGGRFHAQPGTIGGFGNLGGAAQGQAESEGTLGLAEHLSDLFKLEEGAILKSDGTWAAVAAWELDFGGR